MNKLICLSLLVSIALLCFKADAQRFNYDDNEISSIKDNPVYIVLSGSKKLDFEIVKEVNTYWKLSAEIKTIPAEDIKKYLGNKKNFFISLVNISPDVGSASERKRDAQNLDNYRLVFFNGKYKSIGNDLSIEVIHQSDISISNDGATNDTAKVLIIDYAIKDISDFTENIINNQITFRQTSFVSSTMERQTNIERERDLRFSGLSAVLRTKTLVFCRKHVSSEMEKALKNYKYKYKIVDFPQYRGIVTPDGETLNGDDDLSTANCCIYVCGGVIYDAATKEKIYDGFIVSPKNVNDSVEKLNEYIGEQK